MAPAAAAKKANAAAAAATASQAPVALPRFTCETTCFGFSLLLVEIGVTAGFFVLYGLAQVHKDLYMASGIISIISIASGFFGLCRSTPTIVTSLIVSIAVTFAFVLLGGLCIIFAVDVHPAVASYLNKSLLPVTQAANKRLVRDTKICLALAASALLVSALCHALLARHLKQLLGPRRAAVAFLQTFSLIVIPFSMFLVVGGQYIVDSGTLESAPYTGIIVFGCGVLLLTIALLSFIGGSFEYRRLLSMCVLLSYMTATIFVGMSIAYFALKSQIEEGILAKWELLRVVLPPTFQARYDRDQFIDLIKRNLQLVAYVGIVCGLFTFQNAGVCVTLMHHATTAKRQMAHDKQSIRKLESQANDTDSEASGAQARPPVADPQVLQRHAWRQYFESSKRRQRIAMRIFAFLFVVAIALIFAAMCANVVFATKCSRIGKLVEDTNSTLFATSTEATTTKTLSITNQFTRGTVSIKAASNDSGLVRLEQYGNAERNKNDEPTFSQKFNGSTLNIMARPLDVKQFLWIDSSCQRSALSVELPTDALRQLTVDSNASVDIRGSDLGPSLTLRGLSVTTDQANTNASQLLITEGGLSLQSASGEIELSSTTVDGRNVVGVETKADVYAALGSLAVTNASFYDCEALLETGAGTLELTTVTATATSGRSHILAATTSGAIYADSLRANWIEIKSDEGDIYATNLRTEGNNAFMGRLEVTSVSGDVTMQQVDPRGSVHIETSSGNIKLQLMTMAFTGLYYLRSDYGNVTIRQGLYGTDTFNATSSSSTTSGSLEKQGGINCDPSSTSCLSYGDLHLRSRLGDIEVVLGCDTFQCF